MKERKWVAGRPPRTGGMRALLTLCVIVVVLLLAAAALMVVAPGSRAAASFLRAQPGSLHWNERTPLTVLLIGAEGNSPAVAMMVVRYDPVHQSLTTLAIPPDLWVTIPGYGQGRIADASTNGGARLALLTTESALRLPIPYYAEVGPDDFAQFVDTFGGVTVHVRTALRLRFSTAAGTHAVSLPAGSSRVDGMGAVGFIAGGGPGNNVVDRMTREAQIAFALRKEALNASDLFRIPGLITTMGGSFATNVPYDQMTDLARGLGGVRDSACHAGMLGYSNGAVTDYTTNGEQVLLPNWQEIHSLAGSLFPVTHVGPGAQVRVLNGSGIAGQATDLAAWLRGAHIAVHGIGSAPSYSYVHTQVAVLPGASAGARALAVQLGAVLQAPVVTGSPGGKNAPVSVVIGSDFTSLDQQ